MIVFNMELLWFVLIFAYGQCITAQHQRKIKDINPLVIGGENADISTFPYQISVQLNGRHRCGGSILDKNYIVTAAHCTDRYQDQVSNFSVRAGSSIINTGGLIINISELIQHENFNISSMDYDVTVLKLESFLTFSDKIQPISLATEMPLALTNGNLTGWGKTSENSTVSYQLQVVKIPINLRTTCVLSYRILSFQITDRMFCAANLLRGQGGCHGDSGGPFVVNRKLVGIVSFGAECGSKRYPGVFGNVPVLAEWIRSKTTATC